MQIIDKKTSASRKSDLTVYHWLSAVNIVLEILASCLGWNEPGWLAALLVIAILAPTDFTMVFGFKKHSMTLGAHSVMTIGIGLFTLASACTWASLVVSMESSEIKTGQMIWTICRAYGCLE